MARRSCPGCRGRDARITTLQERVHALEAEVRALRARLGPNARNSSVPPSANPAAAPKPVVKQPTGRQPGAQPGHPAHRRRRVIRFVPRHCERWSAPLPAQAGPHDPEPSWHQVAELPELAAQVTEYQGHFCACPDCGTVNHAAIPAEVRAHSIGPRLAATLAYLAGCHHVSKRGLDEGCRFVGRILTGVQTLRLQERSVLGYLVEAIVAHRSGSPVPKLLPAG